ncbi:YARHG domain-containing protein [Muricoccus radiodurans]|uniref:YARHG domain-containing protein n=1 Tax=Muricoccus radiodurans TaxID=2231721 RepID=UPI003CF2CF07
MHVLGQGSLMAQEFRSLNCSELWVARNKIDRDAGCCFRTPRGISTFGHAGGRYDKLSDVPLTPQQRRLVEEISRAERVTGCAG